MLKIYHVGTRPPALGRRESAAIAFRSCDRAAAREFEGNQALDDWLPAQPEVDSPDSRIKLEQSATSHFGC